MKTRKTACVLALMLALAGVVAVSAALAQGGGNPADIVISEVMINAATDNCSTPGNCGEWLEIYNRGVVTIDLAGWGIRDVQGYTKTIAAAMCPNNSCEIPPGGCWLIAAYTPTLLQTEFNNYTSPLSPTVLHTATIFLSATIGNGLANGSDLVALLYTDTKVVGCVSWGSPSLNCTSLSNTLGIVAGARITSTNRTGSDGQSITNIQGQWYNHQRNASPYNCVNTAEGGSPTAVILSAFSARPWGRPGVVLGGAVAAGGAAAALYRGRSRRSRRSPRRL